MIPRVGTLIAVDEPLFHLCGGAADLDPGLLRNALAFGRERTMEQDPMFAFRTPDWEDYVTLAVSEIRHYGATSVQVVRRLRAMLENLKASLPPDRWPPLDVQLQVLDRAIARAFPDPEDQALAGVADFEGVGQVE